MKSILMYLCLMGMLSGKGFSEQEPVAFGWDTWCPSVFYENKEEGFWLCVKIGDVTYQAESCDGQDLMAVLDQIERDVDVLTDKARVSCTLYGSFQDLLLIEKKWEQITASLESKESDFYAFEHKKSLSLEKSFLHKQGWDLARDGVGPKTEEAKPFFDLPLKEKEKKIIRDLIEGIAETPLLQLALPSEQGRIKKLGDKARVVHPLRFIGFILSDAQLRKLLKDISESSFKWPRFVEGFESQMKEEAKKGNLNMYVPGFAELLGADVGQIQELIQKKNYAGVIEFFL